MPKFAAGHKILVRSSLMPQGVEHPDITTIERDEACALLFDAARR